MIRSIYDKEISMTLCKIILKDRSHRKIILKDRSHPDYKEILDILIKRRKQIQNCI